MVNCREIGNIVCDKFNLQPSEFWSKAKSVRVSRPRQMAMALCREALQSSTTRIGQVYGCHHGNVLCASKRIRMLEKDSLSVATAMQELRREIHLRKLIESGFYTRNERWRHDNKSCSEASIRTR